MKISQSILFGVIVAIIVLAAVQSPAQAKPPRVDADGDGLSTWTETRHVGTNPLRADTDRDRLSDGVEVKRTRTNPRRVDTDGDGLSDWIELRRTRTNPRKADSDRDGVGDGEEVLGGSDPRDPASVPGFPRDPPAPGPDPNPGPPPTPEPDEEEPPPPDTSAPDTTITSSPPALTTSTSASFTFDSTEPGSTFECKLDETAYASCSSPTPNADLAPGGHSFSVRATDAAGNTDPTPATFSWTIDSKAPETQIATKPAALTNSATANFTFSGSDVGGSGVVSFECRRDGGAWASCTSPREYTGLAGGAHSFEVKAIDKAGNVDATPATFIWQIDLAAPQVAIDSLSKALLKAGETSDLTWHADENGDFELRLGSTDCNAGTVIDSGPYANQPATHASNVSATQLQEGANTLRLCLTDAAGNRGQATAVLSKDTGAPDTSIDPKPPALVSSTTANFTFSGSDAGGSGVAFFECRRDGGSWAVCSSPKEYTGLSEGAHSFEVQAIDSAGNVDATPASFDWTVDTTPPVVQINSGPSGLTNDSTPTFGFSSEPGASFECSIDSGAPAFGPCSGATSHTPASPLAEGAHTFRVRATDAAANQATATRSFTVDTTAPPAPELNSTVPASPANDNTPQVIGTAPAGTTIKLHASSDCSGSPIATRTAAQLAAGIEVSVSDDSATSFSATATTAAENTSGCSEPLVYVEDSSSPDTTIGAKPAALANSTAANFTFSGSDAGGSGVASFECRRDGGAWAGCASPQEYTSLAEGAHSFEVKAVDQAGNVDASPASFNWTVDSKPPETQINTKPAALVNSATANFTFSGSDLGGSGVASFECRRDGGAWGVCTSPREYTGLIDGAHSFEVKAIDQAGNVDATPASFSWTVDTTPPTVQITSGPKGLTNDSTPTFGFSSEPGASFECSIDTGAPAFGPCSGATSHTPASPLSEGPHTFRVRATDAATNQATATRNFGVDTTAPQLSSTDPPSPANGNNPRIIGNAPTGTTIALYTSADCTGAPLTTVSAPELEAGIEVTVPDDSTTDFSATANVAEKTSGCSEPLTYVEDSSNPETTIASSPPATTMATLASFFVTSNESGSSFECSLDGGAFADCSSPRSYAELALGEHSFVVRAIDAAGNLDPTPTDWSWTIESPPFPSPSGCAEGDTNAITASQVRSAVQSGNDVCVTAHVGNVNLSNLGARPVVVSTDGGSMGDVDLDSTTGLTISRARFRSVEMRGSHRTLLLDNTIGGTPTERVLDQLIFMPDTNNDVVIERNDIGWTIADSSGNTGHGCRCYGDLNRLRFVGNRLHDLAADGFQGVGGHDVLIDRNEIGPVGRNPESTEHSDNIQITGNEANLRITNNWIHHQGYYEGDVSANSGSTYIHGGSNGSLVYENNLIETAQGRTEICGLGTGGEERSNITIRRNTWVDGGLAFNGFPGFEWDCDSGSGNAVERNIAVDPDGGFKLSSFASAATFSANLWGQPSLVALDAAGNCTSANCNPAEEEPIGYRKPSGVNW